ncbi:MAG: glycosyltransferase family 39 protein [Candidatus Levybacteria bacterium]|nr:glycosyltransferase family 39 protein [Candidatus Levybacteria bacterium]
MPKISIALIFGFLLWAYFGIYQLPYYVWTFALTQNWFTDNGLILFKDIIYHHTQLPLFALFGMSKILGNTPDMMRASSFILLIVFSFGILLLGRKISKKVGNISFAIFLLTFFTLFHNFHIEEMMASLFCIYATFFYLKFWDKLSSWWIFFSGIFVSLGIMSKQSVGLIILVFLLASVWQIRRNKKLVKTTIKGFMYFFLGLLIAATPFFFYYFVNHSLGDFFYWNIIFNFTIYPKQSIPYALKDGMIAAGWLLFSIIPSIYLLFTKLINKELRFPLILLTLCAVFLSTSLLPSFLTYKALPFYPYPLIIWGILLVNIDKRILKIFIVTGLLLLLPAIKSFYVDYLPTDAFNNRFILDYGDSELKIVDWLKKNTIYKEKIMNLGHHYVTTLARRLPQNRYVYLFPWLVSPFDVSTKEILKNPPKTVVVDWRTFDDFPVLHKWQFIDYVKTNYKLVAKYDSYEIFSNK